MTEYRFADFEPFDWEAVTKTLEEFLESIRAAVRVLVQAIRDCFKEVNWQEWPDLNWPLLKEEKENRPRFRPERSIRPRALGFSHRPIRGMVGGYR